MTPPAATVAGRATVPATRTTPRPARAPLSSDRPTGVTERQARVTQRVSQRPARTTHRAHRRTLRPSGPAPTSPRRVSGPVGGAVALPLPGRLFGPLPRPSRAPARPRQAKPARPLGARLADWLRALPDNRWLDRLVRGRLWIPLLGVLLTGIVAIQVEVLKLGAGIGRSVNLATQLQSRNELLQASDAQLSDDQRIMRVAASLGMYMPGPTETGFVAAGGRDAIRRAIQGIRSPDAQAFLAALAAQVSSDGTANPTLGSTGSPVTPGSPAATPVTPGAGAPAAGTATSTGAGGPAGTATGVAAGTGTGTGTAGTGTAGTGTGATGAAGTSPTTPVTPTGQPGTTPTTTGGVGPG
jgi:hypothetical protein